MRAEGPGSEVSASDAEVLLLVAAHLLRYGLAVRSHDHAAARAELLDGQKLLATVPFVPALEYPRAQVAVFLRELDLRSGGVCP